MSSKYDDVIVKYKTVLIFGGLSLNLRVIADVGYPEAVNNIIVLMCLPCLRSGIIA